jgi:hypothetical protein
MVVECFQMQDSSVPVGRVSLPGSRKRYMGNNYQQCMPYSLLNQWLADECPHRMAVALVILRGRSIREHMYRQQRWLPDH